MASRFAAQEPDPAIQRNIIRARRKQASGKAQGIVVVASLAATVLGWGLFAQVDAQTAAAQVADTAPAVAVVSATATPTVTAAQSSTTTVLAITTTRSSR